MRTVIGDDGFNCFRVCGGNGAYNPSTRGQNGYLLSLSYLPACFDHGIDGLGIGREFFVSFIRFNHGVDRKRTLPAVDPPIVGDDHPRVGVPELGKSDQAFAKRGRVEVNPYAAKRVGARYACRDCLEDGIFRGFTGRGI